VIRNVVIHVSNEQPLLADLYSVPSSGDVGLVCTNVRMMDGKRPIFIDHADSTIFFPYLHVRFIEIPSGEMQKHMAAGGFTPDAAGATGAEDVEQRLPAVTGEASGLDGGDRIELETEDELVIDEDFLQRVRDI
jgi:hypothetical protein